MRDYVSNDKGEEQSGSPWHCPSRGCTHPDSHVCICMNTHTRTRNKNKSPFKIGLHLSLGKRSTQLTALKCTHTTWITEKGSKGKTVNSGHVCSVPQTPALQKEGWDSRLLIKEQNGRKIKLPHWLEQGTEEKSNPTRAFSVIWPRLAL